MKEEKHIEAMKLNLEHAARTLKYLPYSQTSRHQKLRSIWGGFGNASQASAEKTKKFTPSPAEIDDMYQVVELVMGRPDLERKLLWARANRVPWALLQKQIGRSRTHLYQIHQRGLIALTNLYRLRKPLDIMNKIG